MTTKRIIEAIIEFSLDEGTIRQLQADGAKVEDALQKIRDRTEEVETKMDEVRNWAGYFGDLGESALFFGGAMAGPVAGAMALFISQQGTATDTGRRWNEATKELSKQYQRLGQVAATSVLPFLESAASIAERFAGFAEKNPRAVQALLFGGAGLIGLSVVGEAVERGIRVYTDAKSLYATTQQVLAGKLMESAAAKQLLAAGGMQNGAAGGAVSSAAAGSRFSVANFAALSPALAAASAAAGAFAGVLAVNALAQSKYNETLKKATGGYLEAQTYGKYLTVTAYGLGSAWDYLRGQEEQASVSAARWVAELTGEIESTAEAARDTSGALVIPQQILEAYIDWQKQDQKARSDYRKSLLDEGKKYSEQRKKTEADYEAQRTVLVEQYGAKRVQAEQDFIANWTKQRSDFDRDAAKAQATFTRGEVADEKQHRDEVSKLMRDARREQEQSEHDYYAQRTQAAAQFNIDVQRAEADHQRTMQRMREDHNLRLQDAERGQDVQAFLHERQTFNVQRTRAEEDFTTEAGRRSEDYARQVAEIAASFRQETAERQAALAQQLKDTQTSYEEQRAERQAEFARQKEERTVEFEQRFIDARAEFETEQEQAAIEHQEQLVLAQQQYQERKEQEQTQHTETLASMRQRYTEEQAAREEAFQEQVRQTDASLLGEQELRQQYYAKYEEDLRAYLENEQKLRRKYQSPGESESAAQPEPQVSVPTKPPAYVDTDIPTELSDVGLRASGGYVGSGLYAMGEAGREYVLDANTTRGMEAMLGGLSQDKMLAAVAASSRPSLNLGNRTFNMNGAGQGVLDQVKGIVAGSEQRMIGELMGALEAMMGG